MRIEYLKTLWMLRFEKIKQNEEQAAWKYQELLDKCLVDLGSEHELIKLLSELVHDERHHAKLADELIHICHHNHPECSPG